MSSNNNNNSNSSNSSNNNQVSPQAPPPQTPQAILYGPGESYYWTLFAMSKIFKTGEEPSKELKDKVPPRIPVDPFNQTTFEVIFQFVERLLNCRSQLKLLLAERDLRNGKF